MPMTLALAPCLQALPVIASATVVTCTGIMLFNLMPSDRTNWGLILGERNVVVIHATMALITCLVVVCCTPLLRRYLARHLRAASVQDGGKVRSWLACDIHLHHGLLCLPAAPLPEPAPKGSQHVKQRQGETGGSRHAGMTAQPSLWYAAS